MVLGKLESHMQKNETRLLSFTTHTSDKGLISKIYKELIQLKNHNKTNDPIKKMGRGPEQTLLPRGHTNGQQIFEKMLNIASY